MDDGGSPDTGEVTRHHKSRVFLFYLMSWFLSILLDAHFIMCKYGFSFRSPYFWFFPVFAVVNNIAMTILVVKSCHTPIVIPLV